MIERPGSRSYLPFLLIPILVSIASGTLGIIIYKEENDSIADSASIVVLISFEFVSILSLPLWIINTELTTAAIFILFALSGLGSLGAGLSMMNLSLVQLIQSTSHLILLKAFLSTYLASLLTNGLFLGYFFSFFSEVFYEYEEYNDDHSDTDVNTVTVQRNGTLKEKFVSLKASAATLVDSSIHSKNKSDTLSNSKPTRYQSNIFKKDKISDKVNYSIKKLSVINQSSSTFSIMNFGEPSPLPLEHVPTPISSKFKDFDNYRTEPESQLQKTLLVERDAINRIPSALLPPHLRFYNQKENDNGKKAPHLPSLKTYFSNQIPKSYSQFEFKDSEEKVMQTIPHALSVDDMWTNLNKTKSNNGMRTISLDEWEERQIMCERLQMNESVNTSIPFPSNSLAPIHSTGFDLVDEQEMEQDSIILDENSSNKSHIENSSTTEEALRCLENLNDNRNNNEVFEGAIDQSQSNLDLSQLEEEPSSKLAKSKSYSPHKSIFRHHHQRSSVASFTFKTHTSSSVPSSPIRRKSFRSSPKRLGIKNLSLSNIVYQGDHDDTIPDLLYVHELQSSPSKRKEGPKNTTTPQRLSTTKQLFQSQYSTTPESARSNNSNNSVFPSDVIGQYDKEKWKTMERLHMVDKLVDPTQSQQD